MPPEDFSSASRRDGDVSHQAPGASPKAIPGKTFLLRWVLGAFLALLVMLSHGEGNAITVMDIKPPENVHSLAGEGCIHVLWDGTGAETYRVYRRTATTSYAATPLFTSSQPGFTDTRVENGVTYYTR